MNLVECATCTISDPFSTIWALQKMVIFRRTSLGERQDEKATKIIKNWVGPLIFDKPYITLQVQFFFNFAIYPSWN
jgi:hypothetical protein